MKKAQKFTAKQREWLKDYEQATGFAPLWLDDPSKSFNEVARNSINWYEAHTSDMFGAISAYVPYDEEEPLKNTRPK